MIEKEEQIDSQFPYSIDLGAKIDCFTFESNLGHLVFIGLTNSDLTCNGLQLNALKQLKNCTRSPDSNNTYTTIANYNQYTTGPNIKVSFPI